VGWDGESSSFDLGQREQIFFGKSEIKDSTALSTNRPTGKSPDRAVQSAAWKFQAFFSLCKAALQVTAPFRLADRVEQCALSEPKPTLLQVTGLQLLDPIRTSGVERQRTRRRRRRHPAILCAFLQRALCLRVGGEQWQTRRRDRTIADMPPTSRAKTPRRRLKLARASTEREGCRFQGRRSRGCCKKHVEYRR